MEFSITVNTNANEEFIGCYMKDNYPNFDGFSQTGNLITFIATVVWTSQEQTDITTWYNALTTSDDCVPHYLKIYDFVVNVSNKHEPPIDVDYLRTISQRLHPIVTDVVKGEVREITYYESVTVNTDKSQTGTNPVVKETFVYTRDTDKVAESRIMTISWFKNDGTIHATTKTRQKYYTNEQAIQEGVTRRVNIIDFMQSVVIGHLVDTVPDTQANATTKMSDFMVEYDAEKTPFISANSNDFKNKLITESRGWLNWIDNVVNEPNTNDTIRDYMLDQLNY